MQTPRYLVGRLVELAPGMQDGEHNFKGAFAILLHPVDRNAPPVVVDRDRAVRVDDNIDQRAEPGERLIDRVVDHFIHDVVETPDAGAPDIHGGTLPHRRKPLEHRDVGRIIRIVQRKPPSKKQDFVSKKAAPLSERFTIPVGFNRIKACCTDVK